MTDNEAMYGAFGFILGLVAGLILYKIVFSNHRYVITEIHRDEKGRIRDIVEVAR